MKRAATFVLSAMLMVGSTKSASIMSEPLALATANEVLSASGGLVGNVFAKGDNRYVIRRTRLIGKKGSNIFIGEIEIEPLPKHQ